MVRDIFVQQIAVWWVRKFCCGLMGVKEYGGVGSERRKARLLPPPPKHSPHSTQASVLDCLVIHGNFYGDKFGCQPREGAGGAVVVRSIPIPTRPGGALVVWCTYVRVRACVRVCACGYVCMRVCVLWLVP
jgi:hypothetical protein